MKPVDFRMERVLGVEDMWRTLKAGGWTDTDLREYVTRSRTENFNALDEFAGGELTKAKGLPVFNALLEATAIRYAMHTTNLQGVLRVVPDECPHGYRMTACNSCLKGAA